MNQELIKLAKPMKTASEAKLAIKRFYGFHCINSEVGREDLIRYGRRLDGCHIYPAGSRPELKTLPVNIVPLSSSIHTGDSGTFDWIAYGKKERTAEERIHWITKKVHFNFRQHLRQQLELLEEYVDGLLV